MRKHDPRYSARAIAQAQRRAAQAKPPAKPAPAPDVASEPRIEFRSRLVREDQTYYIAASSDGGVLYFEKRLVNFDGESFWVPVSLAARKGIS